MLHLLIKSTLRLLSRSKGISSVKILGLAAGSAIFLMTSHFCLDEIRYDTQHPDPNMLYRYVHRVKSNEGLQSFAFTNAMTGAALKERYPEVVGYCRTISPVVSVRNPANDIGFNEQHFAFADSTFLRMFNFPLAQGDPQPLHDPLSVVLTPAMAKKYFSDEDPIGKTLVIDGEMEFVVRGVFRDNFRRSHFNYDFVASFSSLEAIHNNPRVAAQIPAALNLETKGFNAFYTYLKLAPGTAAELEAKFPAFIEDFRGKGRSERLKPSLQTVRSIHLESTLLYEIDQNGSMVIVYVYFFVGTLVLLIACINYINISTAELMDRAKGIGLKKILGVTRASLIISHLGETAMVTACSLLIGAGGAFSLTGAFNMMVNRDLVIFDAAGWMLIGAIFLIIVTLSGLYPAVVISRSRGLEALRGTIDVSRNSLVLRHSLVFFQLMISFCLVTISLLIYSQLEFLITKDPGIDTEQVVSINAGAVAPGQRIALKHNLLNVKGVEHVGLCSTPPGEPLFSLGLWLPEHKDDDDKRVLVYQSFIDADYSKTLGIALDSGRFFDGISESDSLQYIVINRAMVDAMGPAVLNRTLDIPAFVMPKSRKRVIGIIDNFNFASFHRPVDPLMLEFNPARCGYLLVRFRGGDANDVVSSIQTIWKENFPTIPLDQKFLDQQFARFYDNEMRLKNVITWTSILAIGLASLGVFGTTLFVVRRRTKEMGIRKILGSGRASLLGLLARPVIILVLVASAAGVPIAFISGNRWLEQYPFRIEFSPVLFVIAFGVVMSVVLVTIVYHSMRVARINPVEVLREG